MHSCILTGQVDAALRVVCEIVHVQLQDLTAAGQLFSVDVATIRREKFAGDVSETDHCLGRNH